MSLIYKPAGKAREYSPLALNIYKSCDGGCSYCFAKGSPWRMDNTIAVPRKDIKAKLQKEVENNPPREQVLLSFLGDPYCTAEIDEELTLWVLSLFHKYQVPTAILTKGGSRCLRDQELYDAFYRYSIPFKVGATLTFIDSHDSLRWEPGAALPNDRLQTLKILYARGIRTWASLEPVIDPEQTLKLIDASYKFVDEYRVGKWNYDLAAKNIDWDDFGNDAVHLLRDCGKSFYIKSDLRKHITISLTPEECDMDYMNLKAREE